MEYLNTIINSDAEVGINRLPDKSVNCCVTSPPYYGLRDYGIEGQIGNEETPERYVERLLRVFSEVHRVLKDDGTLWLNLGDSYAGSWGNYGGQDRHAGKQRPIVKGSKIPNEAWNDRTTFKPPGANGFAGIKPKDLIGVPWMVAFALRSAGWYLRQDIIWAKPNCMPESVSDRCTKSHEYIFMLSKSARYYYDAEAIKTEAKESSVKRVSQDTANQVGGEVPGKTNGNMKAVLKSLPETQLNIRDHRDKQRGHSRRHNGFNERWDQMSRQEQQSFKANKRSVWIVPPAQFAEAHFATFPPELIVDCIKAGCPKGGIVLDPFMGSGTTAEVAAGIGRNFVGIEINPQYIKIAERRLYASLGMFNPVSFV